MAFLFGKSSQANTVTRASGLQLQSSVQGQVIAVAYGTTRLAQNLIWYGDFASTPINSGGGGGKGGVGGGGGGKGGSGPTQYNYSTAFAGALCEGPINGVNYVYIDKNVTSLSGEGLSLFTGTTGQSAWGYLSTNFPSQALGYSNIAYVASSNFQLGTNPQLPNFNFEVQGIYSNAATQEVTGEQFNIPEVSPFTVEVEYYATFVSDAGVIDSDGNVYTAVGSSPGNNQYAVSGGVYTFSILNSGALVNISYATSSGPDADPSLVVNDILTNARYGVGFPSARAGSFSNYQSYCLATGLLISPAYTAQQQASAPLTDIATATNSAWVWAGGALTLIPYGDANITANGYTYTANLTPLFSLTDDDFMANGHATGTSSSDNQDPVLLTRTRPADAYNSIKLEWLNRANSYNPAIIEAKDQALINQFGLRQDASRQFHLFCDGAAARLSVQLQLQRQYVRNLYQFQVDQRYIVLDPMDVIEISDSVLGLSNQLVRIIEITENDDYSLTMSAEEIVGGTGSAPSYTFQNQAGFNVNYNSSPGNCNTPILFEPPIQLCPTQLEVWMAVSGPANWGGCEVYISTDDVNFLYAGRVNGDSRMGVLTANFPSGSDPDTVNTCSVNLSESFGSLSSGTQADADQFHTLCLVDQELIAFETATLTSTYNYNLTGYLRRGAYGTTIASHTTAAPFARLDNGIFQYSYNKGNIGQTLYVKLCGFNIYGGGLQSLADVSTFTHVIQGPPPPGQVQNFSAQQQGNVVVFGWDDLPTDVGLKGYDIAYGPPGSAWGSMELLTEATRGTEMTNAAVPPGTWQFDIRGHDIADQLSPLISSVQLTVVNQNTEIASVIQEPNWLGTTTNFFRHWTGILVPLGTHPCSYYSDWSVFNTYVPDPVSSASYIAPTIDTGYNDSLRVWSTLGSTLGPGQTGASAALQMEIDTWLTGQSDPATYIPWIIGFVTMRYLNAEVVYGSITAGNVSYVTDFTVNIDTAPTIESAGSVSVSPGGTAITFPTPYHTAPYVLATVVSGTGLYATAASITTTGFTAHVWNSSGTDVGGVINWQSNGE